MITPRSFRCRDCIHTWKGYDVHAVVRILVWHTTVGVPHPLRSFIRNAYRAFRAGGASRFEAVKLTTSLFFYLRGL